MLVACAATENFLPPASAMLHSLVGAANTEALDVVVVHCGPLSAEGRTRLIEIVEGAGAGLEFVEAPASALNEFPSGRFHPSIWARALLPDLLPDCERVLYLDADTIVLESLGPLWRTELGDACLAAVASPLYPFMRGRPRVDLGIEDPRRYINSGVLVMDLELMRRQGSTRLLLDYARAHRETPYPDQDALNSLFSDSHVSLHPRWNAQTPLWDLRVNQLPFESAEVREARARPAIAHFTGPFKPWHHLCTHPCRALYFEHLAASAWPVPQVRGRPAITPLLRRLPADWVYRLFAARHERVGGRGRR